jgi:hypothetical protein
MYQGGPYNPNHATAGTFAFRKELLEQTKYNEKASLAEEKEFLKDYTIPFVQLDPLKTILVFSHIHNTFDKKKLLDSGPNPLFRPCSKTVDMFIRNSNEKHIKEFFMNTIDSLLEKYKPGDPIMKPDVLKQIKEIEAERENMTNQYGQIMIQQPGQEPRPLTSAELVDMLKGQQTEIQNQQAEILKLKQIIEGVTKVKIDFTKLSYQDANTEIIETQCKKIQVLEGIIEKMKQSYHSNNNSNIQIIPNHLNPKINMATPEVMVPIPFIA